MSLTEFHFKNKKFCGKKILNIINKKEDTLTLTIIISNVRYLTLLSCISCSNDILYVISCNNHIT